MPKLPGPPDDRSDDEKEAWYEGASTVAQLQADQWAIIAEQYREAAEDLDDQDDSDAADDDDTCPDCGQDLVESFGGLACPQCGPIDRDD